MNNIFIIVLFLLILPGNTLFCWNFGDSCIYSEITDCGKSEQN